MNIVNEIYKPVPGHDSYEASSLGNVRYKKNNVYIILKKYLVKGYFTVCVKPNNSKHKTTGAHRMVALAWIPNPENKKEVNHIDGNKQNNEVSNLEWVTRKENLIHAINTGLRNDTINCSIYDIETKEVHNFRTIKKMAKFLDIERTSIIQYVERSKVMPIRMRYILDVRIDDIKLKYNSISINVYDYVKCVNTSYKSYILATYHTGMPHKTFTMGLKIKDPYYIAGFSFSYQDITPLNITPDQAMEDRLKLYVKPAVYHSQSVELYNYETKEVITCIERHDVINYIDTDLRGINVALNQVKRFNHTWLLGGYGIRRVNQKYPWHPYSKTEILNSKMGIRLSDPIYILSTEGKEDELIYGVTKAMKITNLPRDSFYRRIKNVSGYEFKIGLLTAVIKIYNGK